MIEFAGARRHARALLPVIGLVGGLLGMAACDEDDFVNFIEPIPSRVFTLKDSTFNFTTLHTFSMPDTVLHRLPVTGTAIAVSREFDRVILTRVRQDFLARGYIDVTNPGTVRPDFVVLVATTASDNFNAWAGYDWFGVWGFYSGWGWFAPGFNTTWGIVYPWFPTIGVTSFERGTLIVDLIPTLSVNPTNKTIRSAWAGVATALLNGTITSTTITAAIDEMFVQSPYLVNTVTVP